MSSKIEYIQDDFSTYLSKKSHISASDLKNFNHSPKHYYYKKYVEKEKNETDAFFLGTAVHSLILTPKLFSKEYVSMRKIDRRTTKGKEEFEQFEKQNAGKKILTLDEMDMLCVMATVALQNKTFVELIKDAYYEMSCYTVDEQTGLMLKMRPDIYSKKKSTITDLKSTTEIEAKKFKWSALDYGYHISAAFYSDFLKKDNYIFAVTDKTPPNEFALYQLSDDLMQLGRNIYRMCLTCLAWSYKNDYWCSYSEWKILQKAYHMNDLDAFFELKKTETLIQTIY